ncbi:hypothetical protein TREES_T100019260 [Tupaia chinensis]|uniref:Uncharacterized protein n=1 Tax=Tupaia chinensis TaxID=246437 RepID=L9L5Q2_TUPCH|nr:hypothetical protein TREES_T100019260 [Tupaia chinensis]
MKTGPNSTHQSFQLAPDCPAPTAEGISILTYRFSSCGTEKTLVLDADITVRASRTPDTGHYMDAATRATASLPLSVSLWPPLPYSAWILHGLSHRTGKGVVSVLH